MMLETNNYYGAYNQEGTNILWTNGGIDPWSALGLKESTSQDILFIPVNLYLHFRVDHIVHQDMNQV